MGPFDGNRLSTVALETAPGTWHVGGRIERHRLGLCAYQQKNSLNVYLGIVTYNYSNPLLGGQRIACFNRKVSRNSIGIPGSQGTLDKTGDISWSNRVGSGNGRGDNRGLFTAFGAGSKQCRKACSQKIELCCFHFFFFLKINLNIEFQH